jgi:hypothetical protein
MDLKEIKNFIIHKIILKIKRPVHKGLELQYCLFFNKFIKNSLSRLILTFLKLFFPMFKLKLFLHNHFEKNLEDILDLHITHSFITGLYLWFFLIIYIFLIYILYMLKIKFINKYLRYFKKKNKITKNTIIFNLENKCVLYLKNQNIIV